ncbi:MAG: NADH-quinone oxidoreductase subunit NuoH [Bacteroidales bacterium]|nr:NADH-quinone oxidoreductase subunit NuoH [Bacteroidales bacterium]MBK9357296.1 NADH-quinone oxidoreductase subunit NuoH [Bacteroidales bacterium]
MYDFTTLTKSIHEGLSSQFSPTATLAIEWTIVGLAYLLFVALFGLFLVYAERKVCAAFQQRMGPMRVGPWGLLQTIADFIKLLMKELIMPKNADKFLYNLAPFIVIIVSFLVISVIPFAPGLATFDFDIGIFFVTAVSSVGVIGILLAGWSSNNKYSLIGAMRSGAQIVSYELSVGLSLITMIILAGTMQISGIVEGQRDMWFIFKGHVPAIIAFFVFIIAGTAETNRGPFDLAEAESELTAGFHTEYSGIKFAFFFLAEYINLFIVAAMATTVFLGGWMPLHFGEFESFNQIMDLMPGLFWFFFKVLGVIFLMMWFKWTFPRLRVDQILNLEWKYLLPINLFNILLMAAVVLFGLHF